MTRWHNHYIDGHPHFCTATVKDWEPVLVGDTIRVIYDVWNEAREIHQIKVLAYVVMPNHYHVMLYAEKGELVSQFLRRIQSVSATKIRSSGLWKERPRVLPVYSSSVLQTKIDYLHRNPVRKELVENPEDWEHSSYRQLVLEDPSPEFICNEWRDISF